MDSLHCGRSLDVQAPVTDTLVFPDTHLLAFHLEQIIPFLFPFYRPPVTEGGRAWILELMIKSPVVRQAAVCQSAYFLSLPVPRAMDFSAHPTVHISVDEALTTLRQALRVLTESSISDHLHGAARVMMSIIQMQRFEVAIARFENCHAHLNGAVAVFKQIMGHRPDAPPLDQREKFETAVLDLGPESLICPAQPFRMANAEQNAFRFSTSLLLFDDIIASTVLRKRPELYEFHEGLLGGLGEAHPCIDLEAVVGCQNWVLILLGQIVTLNVEKASGIDIAGSALIIQQALTARLSRGKPAPSATRVKNTNFLDALSPEYHERARHHSDETHMVTQVWALATLLYISTVAAGLSPDENETCSLIQQILDLITAESPPPAVLRAMLWPICISGCLADARHQKHFRRLFERFQPREVHGNAWKALRVIEHAWNVNYAERDLATCLQQFDGQLILLV